MDLIAALQGDNQTGTFQLFIELFKEQIQKNHDLMDVANYEELLRHQGANRMLKLLIRQLTEVRPAKYAGRG